MQLIRGWEREFGKESNLFDFPQYFISDIQILPKKIEGKKHTSSMTNFAMLESTTYIFFCFFKTKK